jgi:hypothetical protein
MREVIQQGILAAVPIGMFILGATFTRLLKEHKRGTAKEY